MSMLSISWSNFKTELARREAMLDFIETDEAYFVWFMAGAVEVNTTIDKDDGADHTDFEENFKPES